ncbi:MAG: hypothetical protein Q8S73_43770, partial [Deltaproteobacteria bacterium]|nr:hypothetical protein [Deltaproteobacteria bacterium]
SFVDALAEELPFDRAIDTYIREMAVAEPLASAVVTRVAGPASGAGGGDAGHPDASTHARPTRHVDRREGLLLVGTHCSVDDGRGAVSTMRAR